MPLKPCPHSLSHLKSQRLPKRRSMSINMGRLIYNGAVVLADSYSYLADGTSRKDRKILHFNGVNVAFAIADASDDADAAKALISTIGHRFANEAQQWKKIEEIAKSEMTDWHRAFRKAPATIFTGAAMLKGEKPSVRLFSMIPPRTISFLEDGYVANGAGSWIANLVYDMLFSSHPQRDPQMVLRECAYLLYRVKEANVFCKGVEGYVLDCKSQTLRHLDLRDIRDAVNASFQLDIVLWMAGLAMIRDNRGSSHNNPPAVDQLIARCDKMRAIVF